MSVSLRSVLPNRSPMAALAALPVCASPLCPRPPSLWQRWWARNEGVSFHQRWYCSPRCFQEGIHRYLEHAAFAFSRRAPRPNRLPLGLILLSQGDISHGQLRDALERQRTEKSGMLGEWLVKLGAVTEQQVLAAVAAQQGCPLFPLPEPQLVPARMYWPELLMHRYSAVPVFHNEPRSILYVGFLQQVDHAFLLCLEAMVRCRTRPCILPGQAYDRQLKMRAFSIENDTITIHQRQSRMEMTRTISNYAEQAGAERCSMSCCGDRLWTRLEAAGDRQVDLLFRLPASP